MPVATGPGFLPGAITGLILAGAAPRRAFLIQAVVVFLVLAAAAATTVHRLVHLATPVER